MYCHCYSQVINLPFKCKKKKCCDVPSFLTKISSLAFISLNVISSVVNVWYIQYPKYLSSPFLLCSFYWFIIREISYRHLPGSPCVLDNAVEILWPKMMVSSSRKFHSLLPRTIQFGTTLILNQSFMFSAFPRWCETGTLLSWRHSSSRLQLEVGRFILVSSPGQPQDLTSVTPAPHNYQKRNSSFSAVS